MRGMFLHKNVKRIFLRNFSRTKLWFCLNHNYPLTIVMFYLVSPCGSFYYTFTSLLLSYIFDTCLCQLWNLFYAFLGICFLCHFNCDIYILLWIYNNHYVYIIVCVCVCVWVQCKDDSFNLDSCTMTFKANFSLLVINKTLYYNYSLYSRHYTWFENVNI